MFFGRASWLEQLTISVMVLQLLSACGGGGGGATLNDTPNPTVAAQIADIAPDNAQDTVSVFVALDTSQTVSAIDSVLDSADAQRVQSQNNFLQALQTHSRQTLQGVDSTSSCTSSSLASRINQAHTPSSGNAVRIDLNACELDALPKLKGVSSVYADLALSTQGISTTITANTVNNINEAVKLSFNGITAQPTLNAHTADGTGQVIALMDSGVEGNHPALGNSKILTGACFSTATNGGRGFCPNGQNIDTSSTNAGVSCAERWAGTRAEALQAGCHHGTAMAAAASMSYNTNNVTAKGMAPNAQILPVQVFNETVTSTGKSLSSSAGDLLAAVEWVTTEARRRRSAGLSPIVAMNMSLGGGSYSAACDSDYVGGLFKTAFANLRNQGVLPIVAAGNGGLKNAMSFPACVSNSLSVSAAKLGYTDLASYANFNTQTKLIALGGDSDGSGRYALPVLCLTAGSYNCWQEVAGTSPATAMTSGAVAALYSVKPDTNLSEVERVLTTDLTGASTSALHLSVSTGNTAVIRPLLRVTANAYALLGATENNTGSTNSSNTTNTATAQAQICVYGQPNYLGGQACAIQAYGANTNDENKDLFYRFTGKVGSIRITDVQTKADLPVNTATVTLYTALVANSQSGSVNVSTPNTTRLTVFNNPTIRMIRIQTQ